MFQKKLTSATPLLKPLNSPRMMESAQMLQQSNELPVAIERVHLLRPAYSISSFTAVCLPDA